MAYEIKIHNFEGPLDLLFHLIEKAEVDIYDIPISEITQQYLDYIYTIGNIDLDNASEFIVMAATLLQIKSKMLLPKEKKTPDEVTADQDDPRAELIEKLIEYRKYKEISAIFKEKEMAYIDIMYKPAEIIDDIDEDKLFLNITLNDIINAFNDVVKRHNENTYNEEGLEHQILEEEYTVDDKIEDIRNVIKQQRQVHFKNLFINNKSKIEIIITFLALLEIIRLREVIAYQDGAFGDIIITQADLR